MRDWVAEVDARLHRGPHAPVARETVEEIAEHLADLHRGALFAGRTLDEANARVDAELVMIERVGVESVQRRRLRQPWEPATATLSGWWRDVLLACRLLRSKRGYSTIVVLTLGVGIGVCTTVFSLFNALLLRPLPYPNPERLVLLWEADATDLGQRLIVSAPNYLDWRKEARSFAAMGIWEYQTFNLSATSDPEQIAGVRASPSLFDVLQIPPALGRIFTTEEDQQSARVAVISAAVWRTHFASDPAVIGRPLRLNGHVFEVVGVMPPGFDFPRHGVGVWVPVSFVRQDFERSAHSFFVAARLHDDVSNQQAGDEMGRIGDSLRARYPDNEDESATAQPMSEYGLVNVSRILLALSAAVALVLVIACVNVASLQLARGLSRRREFVTRLSLGATYRHLARQMLTEGLVIAAAGCAIGIAIAWVTTRAIDLILSPGFRDLPMRGEVAISIDVRVLGFAVAASVLSAVLFAFAPLAGLRPPSLQPLLRDGERGSTRLAVGARRVLVAIEIALALVVLSSAGLMVRSLSSLLGVEPGLDTRNVLTMRVTLPQADTYGPPERRNFCGDLQRELSAVAGVLHASAISHLPLSGANAGRGFTIEGRAPTSFHQGPSANYRLICPTYFATMGITLIAGRDFNDFDRRDGELVTIINRSTAKLYWPDGNAIGQRLKFGGVDSDSPWMTVVGIVEDVKHFGLESDARRELYRPYAQAAWPVMTVVAKTVGAPMTFERSLREALRRVETDLPAAIPRSMEDVVSLSVAWRQTPMRLLTAFAAVGLLLAGIGVYGVLAYYVSQRTREFGVRLALGASKSTLGWLVARQSAVPLVAGLAIGLVASLASGRLLVDLLYGVKPGDPLVLAAITVLLLVVTVISSVVPARRAATIDPLTALRED